MQRYKRLFVFVGTKEGTVWPQLLPNAITQQHRKHFWKGCILYSTPRGWDTTIVRNLMGQEEHPVGGHRCIRLDESQMEQHLSTFHVKAIRVRFPQKISWRLIHNRRTTVFIFDIRSLLFFLNSTNSVFLLSSLCSLYNCFEQTIYLPWRKIQYFIVALC